MAHLPDEEFDEAVSTLTIETVPARDVRLGMFVVFPDGHTAQVEDIEVTEDTIRLITEDMDYETGRSAQCQVLASTEMTPELEFSAPNMDRIRQQVRLTAEERRWDVSNYSAYKDSESGFQVQVLPVELGAKVRVIDPETYDVWDDSIHPDPRAAFDRAQDILLGADQKQEEPEDETPVSELRGAVVSLSGWVVEEDEDEVAWKFSAHDPRYQAIVRQDGRVYVSDLLFVPQMARVELARGSLGSVIEVTENALRTPHLHIDELESAVARLRKKLL